MYQLKAIQSSVDTNRRRNSSFKQEKSYFDQAQRRKSVFLEQIESNSQIQILKNYKSFLPQLKLDSSDSLSSCFNLILNHFKLYHNQMSKPIAWNQFFSSVWEHIQKNGDIYDVYQEVFKKSDYAQKQILQKKLIDISYYEKIIITLGYEMQEDQYFFQFFQLFNQNYYSSIQELFLKGKLTKKQQQDALQHIQFNNVIDYKDDFEDILEKIRQGNNTIWMVKRKCKPTQQYKLNFKIIRRHFALWLHETRNVEIIRMLPKQLLTASSPFINSKINQPILIVDLDETLVHFDQQSNKLLIRQGASEFLTSMHKYYYIIIWTAALPRYAKWALKKIDSQIQYYHIDLLLTREYCIPHEKGFYQKILHMLGQELSTLLIIENDPKSIIDSEKEYLYQIESYLGQDDDQLIQLNERLIEASKFYDEGFSFQRSVKMTFIK